MPHSYDVELEDFVIFSGHLALMKRTNGLSVISTFLLNQSASALLDIASQEPQLIDFDEESYSLEFGEQGPYNSSVLRMTYSSLVTPETTCDVNMASGKLPRVPSSATCKSKPWGSVFNDPRSGHLVQALM